VFIITGTSNATMRVRTVHLLSIGLVAGIFAIQASCDSSKTDVKEEQRKARQIYREQTYGLNTNLNTIHHKKRPAYNPLDSYYRQHQHKPLRHDYNVDHLYWDDGKKYDDNSGQDTFYVASTTVATATLRRDQHSPQGFKDRSDTYSGEANYAKPSLTPVGQESWHNQQRGILLSNNGHLLIQPSHVYESLGAWRIKYLQDDPSTGHYLGYYGAHLPLFQALQQSSFLPIVLLNAGQNDGRRHAGDSYQYPAFVGHRPLVYR
ncbi:unnamed protein product, partial [Notodromas monacha]